MDIAICGSMAFAREILDIKKRLEELGHSAVVPANISKYSSGEIKVEDKWDKIEFDVIKAYYDKIKENDAVLIVNMSKNGIRNYVGGNSLIEMAFAHVLGKKIFLLNPIPQMSYTDEIAAMDPVILNGDFEILN